MKTEREFQLALGKLLNQVRISNNWNSESFMSATKIANVSKSEAYRFFRALRDMHLLKYDKKRRCIIPQFNVNIWQNEDRKMMLIKDIMEMFPNLQQKRGRKGPKQFVQQLVEEIHQEVEEQIVTLEQFSSEDLVQELRNRGYEVLCQRTIVEQL